MRLEFLTVLRSGKPTKMLGLSLLIVTGNIACLICNLYELVLWCHWQVYDMQFELNEIEARREHYPSTISFLNLLNALIAEEKDFSDRGRRYWIWCSSVFWVLRCLLLFGNFKIKGIFCRFVGIFRFVYDHVFGPFPQRAYADPCEKWQLVVACLKHFHMWVYPIVYHGSLSLWFWASTYFTCYFHSVRHLGWVSNQLVFLIFL